MALAVLDAVKRATRDWQANGSGTDWLNHTGTRLAEAEEIAARPDLSADLTAAARDYLSRCRARDDAEEEARRAGLENERQLAASRVELAETGQRAAEERTRAGRRFTRLAVGAALGIALILLGSGALYGLYEFQRRQAADARLASEAGRWLAKSQAELRDDHPVQAIASALQAFRVLPREDSRSALLTALLEVPNLVGSSRPGEEVAQALAWLDDGTVGIASRSGLLRTLAAKPGEPPSGRIGPVAGPKDLRDGFVVTRALRTVAPGTVIAVMSDGSVLKLAAGSREPSVLAPAGEGVVERAAIGRTGATIIMAGSGDGLTVLSCGADNCTGRRITDAPVQALAIDEAETRIAAADEAGNLFVFGLDASPLGTSVTLGSPALSLAVSPDGRRVVAGLVSGEVAVVDPVAGTVVARQALSSRPIRVLSVSPDGRDVAFACGEIAACLWRLPAGDTSGAPGAILRLPGETGNLVALAFAPDGRIATAYADGIVRIWAPDPALPTGSVLRPDCATSLRRLAVAPDGRIAAGDREGGIQVWDRAGRPLPRLAREAGGEGEVRSLAFAPDGRLAAIYDDGALALWPADLAGKPVSKSWDAHANAGLAWIEGGRRIAVALNDGRIALHDPASGRDEFLPAIAPGADPWGLAGFDEGRKLAATYVKGEIRVWDLVAKNATILRKASDATPDERGAAESLAVSPDGRTLVLTADDARLRVFGLTDGKASALLTESASTRAVAWSPDGRHLAALGQDGRIYLWRLEGGEMVRELTVMPQAAPDPAAPGRRLPADWLAWPDPRTLAVATSLGTVQTIILDEPAWLRRAETLTLALGPAP